MQLLVIIFKLILITQIIACGNKVSSPWVDKKSAGLEEDDIVISEIGNANKEGEEIIVPEPIISTGSYLTECRSSGESMVRCHFKDNKVPDDFDKTKVMIVDKNGVEIPKQHLSVSLNQIDGQNVLEITVSIDIDINDIAYHDEPNSQPAATTKKEIKNNNEDQTTQTAAISHPKSCKEQKGIDPKLADGEFTLYVNGDPSKPWTAYCFGMSGASPVEYLSLKNTHGNFNFSQFTHTPGDTSQCQVEEDNEDLKVPCASVRTHYLKLRINPMDADDSFEIIGHDQTFAESSGGRMEFNSSGDTVIVKSMPYGAALACDWALGIGNINLSQTPFEVDSNFVARGSQATGSFYPVKSGKQEFNIESTGVCGWIASTGQSLVPINNEPTKVFVKYNKEL